MIKLLIAGGGKNGRALLEILHKSGVVDIAGVVDPDPKAPGIKYAKKLKIPTGSAIGEFSKVRGLGGIIDTTRGKKAGERILKGAPSGVEVMGRGFTELVREFMRVSAEAEEALSRSAGQLEKRTWGLKKANESIRVLYGELEKKNTELCALDQLKSDFLSTVSHEIRTPLTSIREGVSQVLDGILGATTEPQREFLSMVLSDVDRLSRIIDNLLDVSKIEAGRVGLRKERIDLVKLVPGVRARFDRQARDKGLKIKENFSRKQIEIEADRDRVTQVFANLIGNAVKFTDKGRIEIWIEDGKKAVECCVADTGIGISKEDLPNVFSKFQQFGRASGASDKGTGLGLSIVKGIVEMHKGGIQVESTPGRGTKFVFTLPK